MRQRRIAIVNRGDAAVRLLHAVRELRLERGDDVTTIALYTDPDADAAFVREADEAVCLGPAVVDGVHAYLDLDVLEAALVQARATAAWVGWGFVSERAAFAERCERLGVVFIGPRASVIGELGDKVGAKRVAERAGVTPIPWTPDVGDPGAVGYPLMVKAAAGGGGRGIRRVDDPAALAAALESAASEARTAFGDGTLFLERVVEPARHLEVQIAADAHGGVVALGARDCSVQLRRQKVLEETVAADPALLAAAVALTREAGYTGVGTVEFLVDPAGDHFFMEVNTRLQVEHTVTEVTTGVDLVKLQLDLAAGGRVPDPVAARGHAIEARVVAVDPAEAFRPAPGRVTTLRLPTGPGLRVDTGVTEGDDVPAAFDPLVLKLIAHGRDRPEALARLARGLEDTRVVVAGGATTAGFARALLDHPDLRAGNVDVDWVDRVDVPLAPHADVALVLAAVELAERDRAADRAHLLSSAARGRPEMAGAVARSVELAYGGAPYTFVVDRTGPASWSVQTPDGRVPVRELHGRTVLCVGGRRVRPAVRAAGPRVDVDLDGTTYRTQSEGAGLLRAPSPSIVVGVRVRPGQAVAVGDVLVVLESMKMESTLVATVAGIVRAVHVEANHQVDAGDPLLRVEPVSDAPATAATVTFGALATAAGTDALDAALRRLEGFAVPDVTARPPGTGADRETAVLRGFAAAASLVSRRRATRGISTQEWLYTFLRAPERSREVLPAPFLDELAATLTAYGADGADPGAALDEAVYRLCCAQRALPGLVPVVTDILRRSRHGDVALLERLAEACESTFPAVSDAARTVAHEHYPPGTPDAGKLELWRLEAFDTQHVASSGDLHLFDLTAKTDPDDRRLFVIGSAPAGEIEAAFLDALAMLRAHQATVPHEGRAQFNRVILHADGDWPYSTQGLRQLAHRLAPPTRNLGLDKVYVRARIGGADRLLHMTAPADTGVALGETAPSQAPIRPLSTQQRRLLKLRRRGLRDPYEIVDLLVAPGAELSDFPPGTFTELELEHDRLVEVDRPPGHNQAAIVAGLISSRTAKHPEGVRRVVLLGDPSKGMGALAEPECRRIVAALDLAARLALPVEWFTVSAGARVSMTSGTENMDWVARVLRRIVGFTQAGGEINVVVAGVNVGAQPYFNAEATMLMHTRGILVMTPQSSMLLTGKEALDFAGGVSAEDNLGIGGHDRVMGPNGQAQHWAPTLEAACELLFRHYEHSYVAPGERFPRRRPTDDPEDRDVRDAPHPALDSVEFRTVGDIFSTLANPDRKKPFDMRAVMRAVLDADARPLERWAAMAGAEGAIVWDGHLGGHAVALIGIESRPLARAGIIPADGPDSWTAATLFPRSSKKIARAINAASGNRPVVILANLAGFDGSPESLRELQLEYGAEIGRAITNFDGPIVLCVVSRYHGGAFVVFSKALNDDLQVLAVQGARASVIGGAAAAAVVFAREVARRGGDEAAVRGEIAREFDAVHTIERALQVGSVDRVIAAADLRGELIAAVRRGSEGQARKGAARATAVDR